MKCQCRDVSVLPITGILIVLLLTISAFTGCQNGQSPMVPTEKNPVQPVIIQGNGNRVKVKIRQKWRTDVWLDAISNKQDQDNKLDVEVPLIP